MTLITVHAVEFPNKHASTQAPGNTQVAGARPQTTGRPFPAPSPSFSTRDVPHEPTQNGAPTGTTPSPTSQQHWYRPHAMRM
ncbi:hypothetical protein AcW1_007536 [Taiwanofungus camphoratus]|nr:hypothetical protein AcW2_007408 [Antrodia cinnamomea]KAI0947271.1 hypothetical protein AcV7_009735 [Antrodia cinnamomea]KAI0953277.1 hypothetical protein AcW1_007536 [Antrodia cinnamomea]